MLYRGSGWGEPLNLEVRGLVLDTDIDNYRHTPMFQGLFFFFILNEVNSQDSDFKTLIPGDLGLSEGSKRKIPT